MEFNGLFIKLLYCIRPLGYKNEYNAAYNWEKKQEKMRKPVTGANKYAVLRGGPGPWQDAGDDQAVPQLSTLPVHPVKRLQQSK